MDNNQNHFLDSKTVLAIILVGLVWFGWQTYMVKKYKVNDGEAKTVASQEISSSEAQGVKNMNSPLPLASPDSSPKPSEVHHSDIPENILTFENPKVTFSISNYGMAFKQVKLTDYKDRETGAAIQLIPENSEAFGTGLAGINEPLIFEVSKVDDQTLRGVAQKNGMEFVKIIQFDPHSYAFETSLSVTGIKDSFTGVTLVLKDQIKHFASSTFLAPSTEVQELVVQHAGKTERVNLASQTEDYLKDYGQVSLLSLGTHYFVAALVDRSDLIPQVKVNSQFKSQMLRTDLTYKPEGPVSQLSLKYLVYLGPKSLETLESIDSHLSDVINLGMFSVIAKPLLKIMKWFYSGVGNWGVAVILLTLLVRLFVLPFNVMSYKSMKNMQRIQPVLQGLRERFKDDPQTLNREMMGVMREHKVNPLGGCLPMLLQFPIFLALYQVFGQSIELYQAPFFLWIHDLSQKDPFYILPVLMGVAMFFQQKLTPTTMDPTQAKILMFMPIVFSFMMISLPSGLTLYIFVSTLFSILQQMYFLRDRKINTVTATEVKA